MLKSRKTGPIDSWHEQMGHREPSPMCFVYQIFLISHSSFLIFYVTIVVLMGYSSMAEQRTLNPSIVVRIHVSQLILREKTPVPGSFFICFLLFHDPSAIFTTPDRNPPDRIRMDRFPPHRMRKDQNPPIRTLSYRIGIPPWLPRPADHLLHRGG